MTGGHAPHRIVAVISGPEPQRTMLETMLTEQLQGIDGDHLLVRGLPKGSAVEQFGHVTCVPHLGGAELAPLLARAELIVSRSGYTTLMDLAALGRTALIIPTPGQAEQEYLADLHARNGRFLVQRQHRLDLRAALTDIQERPETVPGAGHPLLERALDDLGTMLR